MKKFILALLISLMVPAVGFGAAATMYVTVAGSGDNSGDSWANAMAQSDWFTDLTGAAEAGDVYYVAGGTYTLSDNLVWSTQNGTSLSPISIIGVKSGTTNEPPVLTDWAYGTDRPLMTDGGSEYYMDSADFYIIRNMRFVSSRTSFCLRFYEGSLLWNSYLINNSTGDAITIPAGDHVRISYSELVGGSITFDHDGSVSLIDHTYFHDGTLAVDNDATGVVYDHCIFDTYTTGIDLGSEDNISIKQNTFYNISTAITSSDSINTTVTNNLFDECATPLSWTTEEKSNYFDYNSYDGDGSSNSNITDGGHSIDSDITLTDPANGDFTLPDSSAAEGVGAQIDTNTGVTGDYNVNIGADQTDTQSGGSSVTVGYGYAP